MYAIFLFLLLCRCETSAAFPLGVDGDCPVVFLRWRSVSHVLVAMEDTDL